MTAILSPQRPQGASSPSPTQHSPQPASSPSPPSSSQAQTPAESTPVKPSPTDSSFSTNANTNAAKPSAKSGHLSAPTSASSPEQSKASPSRGSISRRQSRLSTRTASTRPTSSVFPPFPSSLSYALVRDFAYPAFHPLHYGPQPYESHRGSESGTSSPGYGGGYGYGYAQDRRLSDPPPSWEGSRGIWSAGPWGGDGGAVYGIEAGNTGPQPGDQLPSTSFGYDSDDTEGAGLEGSKLAKNHRKSKSFAVGDDVSGGANRRRKSGRKEKKEDKKDMSHLGTGLDSQGFFQSGATDEEHEEEGGEQADDITNAVYAMRNDWDHNHHQQNHHHHHHNHHNHQHSQGQHQQPYDQDPSDEAFAGPSLALYTFQPENANELALREGQIIQVGYRHGQGWLVAMDLDTGEQGLVPEEYVRLLRDIEGWGEEDVMESEVEGIEGEEGEDTSYQVDLENNSSRTDAGDKEVKEGDVEEGLGERKESGIDPNRDIAPVKLVDRRTK